MKLLNSFGPNPRIVRMFAAEKGIELESAEVDLMGGENRREPYLTKNPSGQLPCLVLDDGACVSEVTAICEYLEDVRPAPALVGSTPEEKAETRMWTRKVDLLIAEPMANGFRFAEGLELFKDRLRVIPQAADDLKATAQENLQKLDGWIEGREFICGDRFTLADVHLFGMMDFFESAGQPIDPAQKNVAAWYERIGSRPSAAASLHPAASAVGMRG